MAKHIILEVRGLSGQKQQTQKQNPNQVALAAIATKEGTIVQGGLMNQTRSDITSLGSKVSQEVLDVYQSTQASLNTPKTHDYMTFKKIYKDSVKLNRLNNQGLLSGKASKLNTFAYNQDALANLQIEASEAMEQYKPAHKQQMKKNLKSNLAKGTAALHYATQAYSLYNQHQMNTFSMSGMTTASIKQQRNQQVLQMANQGVGIGVASLVNPILGLAQTAMTIAQRSFEYAQQTRLYNFDRAKEQYTSNYYRNRLVNNRKVVI